MCDINVSRSRVYFVARMKTGLLLFVYGVRWCFGVRLSPLENNDKLQDINNQYVAEWQWESWPIKQEPSEQDSRSPGARMNVALWKDSSGPTYYIFGGQPVDRELKKIYSDVWKYSVTTRVWERVFPSQSDGKGANLAKIGGMMTLRANLFDEGYTQSSKLKNYNIVLCGGTTKPNATKTTKPNIWNFTRRKKLEEKKEEEPKSLAVYAPKTSKSNTVWQIDLKDKLWTAYVCCCDTSSSGKDNATLKSFKFRGLNRTPEISQKNVKIQRNATAYKNESSVIDFNISKTEDDVDNEQQHLNIDSLKNKKKKINQSKKASENNFKKSKEMEKRSDVMKERNDNKTTNVTLEDDMKPFKNKTFPLTNITKADIKTKKEKYNLKLKEVIKLNKTEVQEILKNKTEKQEKMPRPKMASKYCPEFAEDGEPVTWCDGNNEVLITADISAPQITLWIFNLRTSHWSQQEVKLFDNVVWPGCSSMNSVRYTGNDEEAYIVCSRPEKEDPYTNLTNPSKSPSVDPFSIKLVYRINYKERLLESLGEIQLPSYFLSPEGREIWQNDTKSVLQVIRNSDNDTILLFAYLDSVDLWILTKDSQGRQYFDIIEKIWRGSALKWFNKYNAPLYNLQFITEVGNPETVLIPNPRTISLNEYWPRERGRFIIRVFKNENLKNQSFENRTREQNLTYELLQSDFKPPTAEGQFTHTYSLKVLVFFGISLAIFTVFGFVIFLKRCVTCPPRIRVRNECHKSPLVIRYSVIPDDLLYPVA